MTSAEKYEYWLVHAKYDFETAESMLKTGRWFYVVLLSSNYLGGRYPDFMNDVLNTVTEEFATDIFHRTKEVFVWLQTLKP